MTPQAADVVNAARELASFSHVNTQSVRIYSARLEAFGWLRMTLEGLSHRTAAQFDEDTDEPYEVAALLRMAAVAARCDASNRTGAPYYRRKVAFARLRGCLAAFDALTLDKEKPPA